MRTRGGVAVEACVGGVLSDGLLVDELKTMQRFIALHPYSSPWAALAGAGRWRRVLAAGCYRVPQSGG